VTEGGEAPHLKSFLRRRVMNQDLYAEITERVIGMLEKGVAPWRRP